MNSSLPQAIYDEFQLRKSTLGISTIIIDHNYDMSNLPQAFLPAVIINVLAMPDNPNIWIGGLQRSSKDLIVTLCYQNYDVDFTYANQDIIDLQLLQSQISNAIIQVFNKNIFLSPLMVSLQTGLANLKTQVRGGNPIKLWTKEAKLVHAYDLNIQVMITEDNNYLTEPILGFSSYVEAVTVINP